MRRPEVAASESAHPAGPRPFPAIPAPRCNPRQAFIPEVQRTSRSSNRSAYPPPSYVTPPHLRKGLELQRIGKSPQPGRGQNLPMQLLPVRLVSPRPLPTACPNHPAPQ